MRASEPSSLSKHSSTRSPTLEYSAKLVPPPSKDAPSGYGVPGYTPRPGARGGTLTPRSVPPCALPTDGLFERRLAARESPGRASAAWIHPILVVAASVARGLPRDSGRFVRVEGED